MMVRPAAIGIIGILVVVVAILLHYTSDEEIVGDPKPEAKQPHEARENDTKISSVAKGDQAIALDKSVSGKKSTAHAVMILPEFDIVRIDPDGNMVIAGKAQPDALIEILNGRKLLGRLKADGRGEWVFVPDFQLKPGNFILSLKDVTNPKKVLESLNAVVIAMPELGKNIAGLKKGSRKPLSMVVPRDQASKTATRLIQAPGLHSDEIVKKSGTKALTVNKISKLTLDTIDYDDNDSLIFSGTASPGAILRTYINDEPVGSITANQDGDWTLQISRKMGPGNYQIRIDQTTVKGKVVARIQIPFKKAPSIDNKNERRTVIIQPGNSLWRIAARVYGSGFRYTEIYKANVDQIRDPDLIYPGQVFTLPKAN